MKKYIVEFIVDEEKLEANEQTFEGELGWVEASGIYVSSVEESDEVVTDDM